MYSAIGILKLMGLIDVVLAIRTFDVWQIFGLRENIYRSVIWDFGKMNVKEV